MISILGEKAYGLGRIELGQQSWNVELHFYNCLSCYHPSPKGIEKIEKGEKKQNKEKFPEIN